MSKISNLKLGSALLLSLIIGFNTVCVFAADDTEKSYDTIHGALSENSSDRAVLHGHITIDRRGKGKNAIAIPLPEQAKDPVVRYIDQLTDTAIAISPDMRKLFESETKYKDIPHKIWWRAKDAANFVFSYKGVSQSSEASDVILNEKSKLKSRGSAEYLKQRLVDETEVALTSAVLELAAGLGNTNVKEGAEQTAQAMAKLKNLVGDDQADATREFLIASGKDVSVPKQGQWTIAQKGDRRRILSESLVVNDPAAQKTVGYLHRYNQVGKLYLSSQRVVQTGLGLAALSPTLVAPAAQLAEFVWVMSTGGSEEDKLMREVYLGKLLESRSKALSEKAYLALDYYQASLLEQNPILWRCSHALIGRMAGTNADVILADGPLPEALLKPALTAVAEQEKKAQPNIDDEDKQDSQSTASSANIEALQIH